MSIIVFIGPSLPVQEARSLLSADYRPPAKAADLYAATIEQPQAIGLIDGYFQAVPAVWHKEILYALHQGIQVYGASSMGALRAAELHSFGMTGVGKIFECYANGGCEDDDEVALIHAPEALGYQSLSEPMANIRSALQQAVELNILSLSTHDLLFGLAKSQYYPDRSWISLGELGLEAGAPTAEIDQLLDYVEREKPNQKRADARDMLVRMARDQIEGFSLHKPNFQFERSIFFHRLTESTARNKSET